MTGVERAAEDALPVLGPGGLRAVAERLVAGWPTAAIVGEAEPGRADSVRRLLEAVEASGCPVGEVVSFLRGLAAGYARHAATVTVETVWSGPSSHAVPVRATSQALVDVVNEASGELLLMTYSAKPYQALRQALIAAVDRGVDIVVVVETLQGAGSALSGAEPAAAFASIPGLTLWQWPPGRRAEPGSKMHAKLAVADRRTLLVSSANLTQSGGAKNIEAGVLIHGGTAPQRAAEHIVALQSHGVLAPLSSQSQKPPASKHGLPAQTRPVAE